MNEYLRKIFHLLIGLGIAAVIWFLPKEVALPVFAVGLLAGMVLIDLSLKRKRVPLLGILLQHLERKGAFPGQGALFFAIGALFVLVLFPSTVAAIAVGVLAVLDSVTALAGMRFGRHRIANGKSLEGFLAGFLVTAILLLGVVPPGAAIVIALVAGLVELVSPVDDNLIIPVFVAPLVWLAIG
jgi:phytol kinase